MCFLVFFASVCDECWPTLKGTKCEWIAAFTRLHVSPRWPSTSILETREGPNAHGFANKQKRKTNWVPSGGTGWGAWWWRLSRNLNWTFEILKVKMNGYERKSSLKTQSTWILPQIVYTHFHAQEHLWNICMTAYLYVFMYKMHWTKLFLLTDIKSLLESIERSI